MELPLFSLLGVGFLLGLRHAVDADHVAAMASFTVQAKSWRQSLRHGITWGLGHTVTLFIFSLFVSLADTVIPQKMAHYLEFVVGLMLLALGSNLLLHMKIHMKKNRVHIHGHSHGHGREHIHFHSHPNGTGSDCSPDHNHEHRHLSLWKTLYIGIIHGMAGSAALILLAANSMGTANSMTKALLYALCFGLGSLVGMGVLSAVWVLPFLYAQKRQRGLHKFLQWSTSLATVFIGLYIVVEKQPFF